MWYVPNLIQKGYIDVFKLSRGKNEDSRVPALIFHLSFSLIIATMILTKMKNPSVKKDSEMLFNINEYCTVLKFYAVI